MQKGNTDRLVLTSNELTHACTDMHGSVCVCVLPHEFRLIAKQLFSILVLQLYIVYLFYTSFIDLQMFLVSDFQSENRKW